MTIGEMINRQYDADRIDAALICMIDERIASAFETKTCVNPHCRDGRWPDGGPCSRCDGRGFIPANEGPASDAIMAHIDRHIRGLKVTR